VLTGTGNTAAKLILFRRRFLATFTLEELSPSGLPRPLRWSVATLRRSVSRGTLRRVLVRRNTDPEQQHRALLMGISICGFIEAERCYFRLNKL
jgi:hypothetical protein